MNVNPCYVVISETCWYDRVSAQLCLEVCVNGDSDLSHTDNIIYSIIIRLSSIFHFHRKYLSNLVRSGHYVTAKLDVPIPYSNM